LHYVPSPPDFNVDGASILLRGFQKRLFSSLDQNTPFLGNIEIEGRGGEASNFNHTIWRRLFSSLDPER